MYFLILFLLGCSMNTTSNNKIKLVMLSLKLIKKLEFK